MFCFFKLFLSCLSWINIQNYSCQNTILFFLRRLHIAERFINGDEAICAVLNVHSLLTDKQFMASARFKSSGDKRTASVSKKYQVPSGPWSQHLSPVSVVLSGWESLTPPGWDTNPSQVSFQQTLVLRYLPQKDRKLSYLRWTRGRTNIPISGDPGSKLGTLWWEILPTAPTMPTFLKKNYPRI